jgi:predicted  nucleic acid-binding Zn-ribbon protein
MSTSKSRPCADCGNEFPSSAERCPHCGRPGLFPNVFAADAAEERDALDNRYRLAMTEAVTRGADSIVKDFENAVADSRAVIARSSHELLRLATSDNEIYGTYYNLIDGGVRIPEGSKWDILRVLTDDALFPNYKEQIRFASLSLNKNGLSNYGEFSIVLRTDLIAHRATVFEENCVLFMAHHNVKIAEADKLPQGYRAVWNERAKLCAAKLSEKIDDSTRPDEYSDLLLRQGATSAKDEFVEVHIWGPMTVRTIEEVTVNNSKSASRAVNKSIKARLAKFKVKVS